MATNQIYSLVNSVVDQSLGKVGLTVVDTSTLVSMGDIVLSSQNNTEAFLDTLVQRIGRTILSHRAYKNKLAGMVLNDFEYGAILQKIKVEMPDAKSDSMYGLTDGQSVDHYIVAKPVVKQKLFTSRTPYSFYITIQRQTLKEAFTGDAEMSGFIGAIFGEVRNKIELSMEDLARACLANMTAVSTHEIKLVTLFKAETGNTTITSATALSNADFLRFAISKIKEYMDGFTDMSQLYNDGTCNRHTPYEEQQLLILSKLERRLETVVQWAAFNEQYVKLTGYTKLNFWQSASAPDSIKVTPVKNTSEGKEEEVSITNLVAILHDKEACGIYKLNEDVATTPINARGMYYNTFWHEKQLWFNDLSENFVYFTLN